MVDTLENFLRRAHFSGPVEESARMELATGCAKCGRRLLLTNNLGVGIRAGTAIRQVFFDANSRNPLGVYPICLECQTDGVQADA